jgi:DNA-binding transcriptional ArsR family regulator
MNVDALRSRAGLAAGFLKVLANQRRLMIVCELLKGERSVGQLTTVVGLSQSALSQHLAKLRRGRLVKTRRESQTIHYSIADPGVKRVVEALYDLYCGPLRRR